MSVSFRTSKGKSVPHGRGSHKAGAFKPRGKRGGGRK